MQVVTEIAGFRAKAAGTLLLGVLMLAGCGGSSSSNKVTTAPTFSPGGGTYTASQTVIVASPTPTAVLYCTTDGTTPTTSSAKCAQPTIVFQTEFLQAIAVAPGMSPSAVASAGYVINLNTAPAPTFSPTGGTFTGAQQVTISDSLAGANIYYTLDGTMPTTSSMLYSGAVTIAQSATLSAIATSAGYTNSGVASAAFTIQTVVPAPTITSIAPTTAIAGGAAFTLTVNGANYAAGATVQWNGAALKTAYVSATQLTAMVPANLIAAPGTANVTVVTPSGISPISAFTISAAIPTITGITPASGTTTGGTSVTITGTNFTGATAVNFGAAGASFIVNSGTSITATSPVGTGTVDVKVTTAGGTSATSAADQFSYIVPAPTVTAIAPAIGPTIGGSSVTITGTNFSGVSGVSFGGTAASGFTVNSATSITATSPRESAGAVDVTVTTANGTSVTSAADQFTYSGTAPALSALSPSAGPPGTAVTISGSNFGSSQGNSTVSFNGTAATTINSWGASSITAVVPVGATSGPILVTIGSEVSNGNLIFSVGTAISGTVMSGASPVVGNVQLYAAGTTGYGVSPTKIGGPVATDANGNFSAVYDCSTVSAPGDQLYLVATGTVNTSAVLMSALGSCGGLSTLSSVTVNEVTTVASAYALSAFASMDSAGGIDVGAPGTGPSCNAAGGWLTTGPSTCNYMGLMTAFGTANNMVNPITGQARAFTPAYSQSLTSDTNVVNNSTVPTARINALADMLASCVENNSGCGGLLGAAATTGASGVTPKDTLQAAMNIAMNPGNNVTTLLGLAASLATPPYATNIGASETVPPTDLTLALTFTGAGLGVGPVGNAAYSDPLWVANSGMAIDAQGNIWVAAFPTDGFSKPTDILAEFNSLGAPSPLTPATIFNTTTPSSSTWGGFNPQPTNPQGLGPIAIDQTGSLWMTGEQDGVLKVNPSLDPTQLLPTLQAGTSASSIAIDTNGFAWLVDANGLQQISTDDTAVLNGNNGFSIFAYASSLGWINFDLNGGLWATGFDSNGAAEVFQLSTSDGSLLYAPFANSAAYKNTTLVADASGDVYGCDPTGTMLYEFNNGATVGSSPYMLPKGISCGTQLVLDGQGHIFAANVTAQTFPTSTQTLYEFTTMGVALSPVAGYTGTSSAETVTLNPDDDFESQVIGVSAAMDGAGNLWVLNVDSNGYDSSFNPAQPGNALVEFVGIGAPVVTPVSVALTNGTLGTRP
ncbi:IPT/TIG domain-containing protein [Acidicapsa ligni]|uniref:IPT/TIG domain-containing protein n=1 Tax=Acidicapsa ligni TaxID=542300 RepID=UPI0021E027DB|nr:IPT/TIG domain-containing protein [Acidicapsa ligni]